MTATNKYLAQSHKTRTRAKARRWQRGAIPLATAKGGLLPFLHRKATWIFTPSSFWLWLSLFSCACAVSSDSAPGEAGYP